MTRYFPEVVEQVRAQLPPRCVVDGEVVLIRREDGATPRLDFELLQQRIHPAASRVKMLAEHDAVRLRRVRPARARRRGPDGQAVRATPRGARDGAGRRRSRRCTSRRPPTTSTTARSWFEVFEGAGLDGLIAKPADIAYVPGKRLMYKIKHARTADCVVAGFRYHKTGGGRRLAAARALRRRGPAAPRRGQRDRSAPPAARSCSTSWRRYREDAARGPPVAGVARGRRRGDRGRASASRAA